ncbi:hypothetical protein PIROE2DRAFT_12689 [Piromyces sp. E2]|nr:hypothetical protein PIROE2DRAFT_12689 [Piromyces sp. E2]|eukprot:OUM61347.1 hypothetical protein PIROE2DRAFT_12689 [Piromyces sp. E2]
MIGIRQGCPLSPILFNLIINDHFEDYEKFGVEIEGECGGGGLFADDIVLWAIENNMTFGINKCTSMKFQKQIVIRTLVIPFDNYSLSHKTVINSMNNKVRKALFKIRSFLKNPLILIPFKRSVISSTVLGIVAYYAPLLTSNKSRTNRTQQLVIKGLYWISGSFKRNNGFLRKQ